MAETSNPFRFTHADGQPSTSGKPLELLLTWGEALRQSEAVHAASMPLATAYVPGHVNLVAELGWNSASQALELTVGPTGDQVHYVLGAYNLFEALGGAERDMRRRQAALEVSVAVPASEMPAFRERVERWDDHKYEGYEDVPRSTWAFWDEHPGLAPDFDTSLGIVEEKEYEEFFMVRLWVSDAQTALSLGHICQQFEQQEGGRADG